MMNIKIKRLIAIFLSAISIVFISNFVFSYHSVSTAQNISSTACSIDPILANRMKVAYAQLENNDKGSINMGDRIDVAIRFSEPEADTLQVNQSKVDPATVKDLKTAIDKKLITPDRLILYLNKYPLKGTYGEPIILNPI